VRRRKPTRQFWLLRPIAGCATPEQLRGALAPARNFMEIPLTAEDGARLIAAPRWDSEKAQATRKPCLHRRRATATCGALGITLLRLIAQNAQNAFHRASRHDPVSRPWFGEA
jgi:hypothetical protein